MSKLNHLYDAEKIPYVIKHIRNGGIVYCNFASLSEYPVVSDSSTVLSLSASHFHLGPVLKKYFTKHSTLNNSSFIRSAWFSVFGQWTIENFQLYFARTVIHNLNVSGGNLDFHKIKKLKQVCSDTWTCTKMQRIAVFATKITRKTDHY